MKDQKIRDLLKTDKSAPVKPTGEWVSIMKKIENDKITNEGILAYLLKFKLVPSFAVLMLFIIGGYQGQKMYNENQEHALEQFLWESGEYFVDQSQDELWP
jgi:hypothetical protein